MSMRYVRDKVAPLFNTALSYEGIWGTELLLHKFFTPTTDGPEWSDPRPGCFTPKQTDSSRNPLDGKLGGPQKNPMSLAPAEIQTKIFRSSSPLCLPS